MTVTIDRSDPLAYLDDRPVPGAPRDYHFPAFAQARLANGLTLLTAHLPGRPLVVAHLLIHGEGSGVTGEPAAQAGATVLAARAMTEGTANHDAVSLIEASERLGAEVSADAGWESFAVSVDVPRSRIGPALALLAEVALQPSFPADEVERLREERLNDLLQAQAEPRRRVERAFAEAVYASDAAYRRSMGGSEETVPGLDRDHLVARHASLMRPGTATLLLAGDLTGLDATQLASDSLGSWSEPDVPAPVRGPADSAASGGRQVIVVDRPGSPQSELRIGHRGVPRNNPDFHAISVLNALLGGLFGLRLNALLREQKGYTYGVHSSFDMRVGSGPFAVRTAVQTEFTVPSVVETLGELQRIREGLVTDEELTIARDYLVGVFPLRYETSGQVAGAIAGLIAHGLPQDELDRYRPAIAAVTAEQVLAAAQRHIRPAEAAIVIVGDADAFVPALQDAGIGDVQVVREEVPGGIRVTRSDAPRLTRSDAPEPLVIWSEAIRSYDFGPEHPLTPRRFGPGIDLLRGIGASRFLEPALASDDQLTRLHTARYVAQVRSFSNDPWQPAAMGIGPGDCPPFHGIHEASALVAGGSIGAAEAILAGDALHAFNPGGGLHHAMAARASGFCIYNDVALGVAVARDAGHRVLYVDLDVHHGDGTQALFADDPNVLTFSIHESGRSLFPGTGDTDEVGGPGALGTAVNIPLDAYSGDASWLAAVETAVPALAAAFRPTFLVSQHGCDSHVFDPLAHLRLTTAAYMRVTRLLDEIAHAWCDGRWLATGGGGYDAYRVVPRSWGLVWLAQAHRDVPAATPTAWRERWTEEAARYHQAPLPMGFHDPEGLVAAEPAGTAERNQRSARSALEGALRLLPEASVG